MSEKLRFLTTGITFEAFHQGFQSVSRPDLIHAFQEKGVGSEPSIG